MVIKQFIKIKILLKQNWLAFLIVILWFFINLIYFFSVTNNIIESELIIFFFLVTIVLDLMGWTAGMFEQFGDGIGKEALDDAEGTPSPIPRP